MNTLPRLRRLAALGGLAALLAFPSLTAAANPAELPAVPADRTGTCEEAAPLAVNDWVRESMDGPEDVDWFAFTLSAARPVRIVLGELPVDASLELYGACGTRVGGSSRAGTTYEELFRRLPAGAYRVKVTAPAEATGSYRLRVQVMPNALAIVTSTAVAANRRFSLVGEVYNGTSASRFLVRVTVTFYDRANRRIGQASTYVLDRRVERSTRSGFSLSTALPAGYYRYKVSLTSSSRQITDNDGARVTVSAVAESAGRIRVAGTVVNVMPYSVAGARVIGMNWNDIGVVYGVSIASASPSRLGVGATGRYTLYLPSCATHGCYTQLRGQARH